MEIKRNFSKIGSTGVNIQKSSESLRKEKEIIQKNINDILNDYNGTDSKEIVNQFNEATDIMDIISLDFENLGNYMQKFAEHDRDNLENTKNSFNQICSDFISNSSYGNILNQKLNINIDLNTVDNEINKIGDNYE